MATLSDLQCILLSTASQRKQGEIHPYPASVDPRGGAKAIAALLRRGFVEERPADDGSGEVRVHITAAGLHAIGVEVEGGKSAEAGDAAAAASPSPSRPTKSGLLLALLERPQGALMPDLIEATGWLPHTVRAALTGLRRKGHAIGRSTREGKSCYHIGSTG